MKNYISLISLLLIFTSCIIDNPKPEACVVENVKITKITEGRLNDIVFHDDGTDFYYINRGLERGLNLDSLNAKVLNKRVTLHLPKLFGGVVTSEHIAQLAIDNGQQATVWSLVDIANLPEDAKKAADNYLSAGGQIITEVPKST